MKKIKIKAAQRNKIFSGAEQLQENSPTLDVGVSHANFRKRKL
jgi:hypothetical protein